jgi:hypothetical protein
MTTTLGIALVLGVVVFGISAYTASKQSSLTGMPVEWKYPIGFGLAFFLLVIIIGAVAA